MEEANQCFLLSFCLNILAQKLVLHLRTYFTHNAIDLVPFQHFPNQLKCQSKSIEMAFDLHGGGSIKTSQWMHKWPTSTACAAPLYELYKNTHTMNSIANKCANMQIKQHHKPCWSMAQTTELQHYEVKLQIRGTRSCRIVITCSTTHMFQCSTVLHLKIPTSHV